jgi:hypothetical protein
MSDIPDEIVERVAKEIYLSLNGRVGGRWELVETKRGWRSAAVAALSASGWGEMREALQKLITAAEKFDDDISNGELEKAYIKAMDGAMLALQVKP